MTESLAVAHTGGRERILEEALTKFIESGYATVSMQQIADAAGVTKATLYHHFRDKEDLFFEVLRTGFTRSQENLVRTVDRGQSLREQLISFADYMFSSERADLNRLFQDLHQHVSAERQADFWRAFERPWRYLESPMAEGIASGEIAPGDPLLISRVCFTAIAGQIQIARFQSDGPYPDIELAENIVDMLLNGLRPR